jgi:Tripartite tricarboxylate transporter family receptor
MVAVNAGVRDQGGVTKEASILVARQTFPAKDVNDLIGWLKANPEKASMGVITASNRLVAAFFQKETGTNRSAAKRLARDAPLPPAFPRRTSRQGLAGLIKRPTCRPDR